MISIKSSIDDAFKEIARVKEKLNTGASAKREIFDLTQKHLILSIMNEYRSFKLFNFDKDLEKMQLEFEAAFKPRLPN